MLRVRPEPKRRLHLGALHALLLVAGAAGLCLPERVYAQEDPQLRGAVADDGIFNRLLRPRSGNTGDQADTTAAIPTQTEPPPAYVPASAGAIPDETAQAANDDSEADPLDGDAASTGATPAADPAAETDATSTGAVRTKPVDAEEREDLILDKGAEREEAIEGLDRKVDDKPFEAPGIRMGTFILKPTMEQGVTVTSNADSSTTGSDAVLSETALRLNAASDWATNSATVDAYGTFRKTISGDEVSDVAGGIDAALTLDLGKDYRVKGTLGLAMRPESATSPVVIPNAESQPLRTTLNGSLGLEKDVGKARFALTGAVSSDFYEDAELEGGGTLSQKERNSTLYSVALRTGYEISPAITPFIETEVGRRIYELELDSAGYARSSNQIAARAGVALDLGEKLSGEASAGWIHEDFDDKRLASISGPSIEAALNWSPVRGTIVGLAGSTTVEGTTSAGESGSILYSGQVTVNREMRANLTGNAALGLGWRDYTGSDGHDMILNAEAGLTWWLNRYAGLTGRARHETVKSNLPDRDSETNSIFLGLKLQR